ncbi:hypothetical protein, partial [Nocardioides lentus]|uniref:hypothetical protein n=1 Tax=Nocardioides lentus TaxID=338077 RepID=UPI0031DD5666
MRAPRPSRTPARRRAAVVAGLTALILAATACGGSPDEDPAAEPTGAQSGSGSDGGADPSAPDDPTGEPTEETPDADSEITPPGTRLEADETAVVVLPDSSNVERGLVKVAITLDSVTKEPLSRLPPGAQPGASDLYFVEQTYTILDKERGNIIGTNLLDHTIVTSEGRDVFPFVDVAADPEGCAFADFSNVDEVGDAKVSCTAFLLPRGGEVEEVAYRDNLGDYDFLDGEPVRWTVETT